MPKLEMHNLLQILTGNESALYIGDVKRTFLVHKPIFQPPETLVPLLLVLHGAGANSLSMVKLTLGGFDTLSDKEGFFVVYPNAINRLWKDGLLPFSSVDDDNTDDTIFISALIDHLLITYPIDPGQVFITGMSNGAIMAYILACKLSNRIAAIAPVNGNFPENMILNCIPSNPVSVLAVNNTADPIVPWNGGEVKIPLNTKKFGNILSVEATIALWVKLDGCDQNAVLKEYPVKYPEDGIFVTSHTYSGSNQAQVVLYTVHGGGHTWPGGLQYLSDTFIGRTCREFDACQVIWDFFKSHHRSF